MSLLRLTLVPGEPIVDQVVFAAVRAFVSGALPAGQPFPSVRVLAADLKIHPNTALKAVQQLIKDGWLDSRPGVGTIVAARPADLSRNSQRLIREDVERLVVQSLGAGIPLGDVLTAIKEAWQRLGSQNASHDHRRSRTR